jgi:hypothetical protein
MAHHKVFAHKEYVNAFIPHLSKIISIRKVISLTCIRGIFGIFTQIPSVVSCRFPRPIRRSPPV